MIWYMYVLMALMFVILIIYEQPNIGKSTAKRLTHIEGRILWNCLVVKQLKKLLFCLSELYVLKLIAFGKNNFQDNYVTNYILPIFS